MKLILIFSFKNFTEICFSRLVCGDVRGNFKYLFNRVETINKKNGPFELLLCVGDFFGENNDELIAYRNGFKCVPIPTYILGPNKSSHTDLYSSITNGEICTNLTYLGRRGLYTISSGIKIAYVSGCESNNGEIGFSKEDIMSVKNSCAVSKTSMGDYRGVDILITSQWPKGVTDDEKIDQNSSLLLSWLSAEIRPRYHFCGLNGVYNERVPFRNPAGANTQMELATRFIALANVNTEKDPKTKFIYALSIAPVDKMRVMDLIQKTTNETASPYSNLDFSKEFKSLPQTDSKSAQYFYDMSGSYQNKKRNHNQGQHDFKRQRRTFDQEKCWFCLSSKDVEKHLIISIGESFYLAIPKGPITIGHVLILSVTHIASASLITNDDWTELNKFKVALKRYFASKDQCVVFYERNYKSSHLQINAVPVSKEIEWQIKPSFDDKAEEHSIQFETIPELTEPTQLPETGPYFTAELPDDSTLITRSMKNFPLHFGREVMCAETLLDCEDKTDWKECQLSKDEEVEMVKQFRNEFKEFDFTV